MSPVDKVQSIIAEYSGSRVQGFSPEAAARLAMARAEQVGLELDADTLDALVREAK